MHPKLDMLEPRSPLFLFKAQEMLALHKLRRRGPGASWHCRQLYQRTVKLLHPHPVHVICHIVNWHMIWIGRND